ncbi:Eco57I restriction-modification methylase domain-containing protein [Fructilactobacillus cliffordii]|uniref:Eco57I restriction-modification methylase domain-containing protein n=1 Tax=Fructilactobacillus cliffordii TaxID=2940299 RepID=UPI00209203F8|nr:Eco57I restriction-modification methylase domain-containing protein [Fructilactobacillus cliffordii]USS86310.1 Eco57I restriction-modification methylase domain-containing protein [Fructilactobacillus cliffordii]
MDSKDFKFDVVIGNPPYQDETIGDNKGYAPPIYHKFLDDAYKVGKIVEMIHPGRFLFDAGSTPKSWNKKMLNNNHIKVIYYEQNSNKVFNGTDIKGGVAVTYYDENKIFKKIGIFTPFKELRSIFDKVVSKKNFVPFSKIIFSPENYKFTNKMHQDYPDANNKLSNGHKYDLKSNVFDKLPDVFLTNIPEKSNKTEFIKIYGLKNRKRTYRYIKSEYIKNETNLNGWKVFVPKANGNGELGEVLSTPVIGNPLVGNTQTFISIGNFVSRYEASAVMSYIKTKFCRTLLGILKITQDNTQSKWSCVPLQDFSTDSDIDWSKSIPEIDKQLYKKYGLDTQEINFIETRVKEMK